MKEFIEKYKEFKTNRRKVGLYKLGFWILFALKVPSPGHKPQ